ncbi:nucleotide exchange factor GrpE [Yaniella flava]|uniref:Protein GrpE n=1 Tax=Yaniella flava TaxID=287930 RepID=A0ABP5G5E2_9MICC|nr:nucleotide exchange factor GrpE [Micrococcaceae bacterium]
MTDQPNHEEHEDPIRFTDKRRIDPETGELRDQDQQVADEAEAPEDAADASDHADPLSQVEDILNSAPTDADEEPETEAASAGDEAAALREDLQRLQAEFVNYRRRVERDRHVAKDNANFSMLDSMLPVLDDIDAADKAGDLDGPFAAIARKLIETLEGIGLVKHDGAALVGEPFDPTHHEAMLRQPSTEIAEEHIVQVFRNGYLYNDRVLRAAQVMVSAGDE